VRKLLTTPRCAPHAVARAVACCVAAAAFGGPGCYPPPPTSPKPATATGGAAFGWSATKTDPAAARPPASAAAPAPAEKPAVKQTSPASPLRATSSKPGKGYGSTGKKPTAAKSLQPVRPPVNLFAGAPPATNRSAGVESPAPAPAAPSEPVAVATEHAPPRTQTAAELAASQPAASQRTGALAIPSAAEPLAFADDLKLAPAAEQKAEALARYAAGALYELRREPDKALEEYEAALKIDPGHVQLATKVGAEFLRRKQPARALPILEKAAALNPASYEIHVLLALAYQAADQKLKAVAANKKASEINPVQIVPYQSLVGHYVKENKTAEALRVLERGFKQPTDDARFWIVLGDLYAIVTKLPDAAKAAQTVYAGKFKGDRAVECYEKARRLAPQDLSIPFRLAGYYATREQFEKAIALYKEILAKRPDALDVRERLAYAYAGKKDLPSAIAQFEEVVKRQPANWQVYFMLGGFYEENKDLPRAQANYEQALILNPNEQQLYLRLARLHLAQKRPDDATRVLDRARDRFPGSARVPYFFGLIHSSRKDYAKSIASFETAERMAKAGEEQKELLDSSFYFFYGSACERAGQFDRAVALFRDAIKLNPDNDEACNYLGYMFAEKGVNLREAEGLIKQALKAQPNNGAYLDSLGWVYYRLGRHIEALKHLRAAAKTDAAKEDATIFEHLADVYVKLGKKKDAIEHLQKALQIEPDKQSAIEKLKALQSQPPAKPRP